MLVNISFHPVLRTYVHGRACDMYMHVHVCMHCAGLRSAFCRAAIMLVHMAGSVWPLPSSMIRLRPGGIC